jgi:hypothetical protein
MRFFVNKDCSVSPPIHCIKLLVASRHAELRGYAELAPPEHAGHGPDRTTSTAFDRPLIAPPEKETLI